MFASHLVALELCQNLTNTDSVIKNRSDTLRHTFFFLLRTQFPVVHRLCNERM